MKTPIQKKKKSQAKISTNDDAIQKIKFQDNRQETSQLKKLKEVAEISSNAPTQLKKGNKFYWYRVGRTGAWTKAGSFGNHKEASNWLKANKTTLGITDFGQGGKKKYK